MNEAERLAGELESGLPVTGSAAAELRRLAAINAELIETIEKALGWVEISHRPPIRDTPLECGRMVMIRLHALADLHDVLQKAKQ